MTGNSGEGGCGIWAQASRSARVGASQGQEGYEEPGEFSSPIVREREKERAEASAGCEVSGGLPG